MHFKRFLPIGLLIIVVVLTLSSLLISCGKEANIDYIEIYNSPRLTYLEGEEIDLSNAQVRIVYKNNTEKIIDVTPSMISGFDPTILGKQYVQIFYEDRSATLEITVVKQEIQTAVVLISSGNATLVQDQNLNLDNAFISLTLMNGETAVIPITEEMCTGFDRDKIGKQTITVNYTYGGQSKEVKFVVSVIEKELTSIEVTQNPIKNIYYVGEPELDLAGGKLLLKYNSGYSTEISMTNQTGQLISGLFYNWNNITVSEKSQVEVIYGGFSATFDVKVKVRDVLSYRFLQSPGDQMQNIPLDLSGSIIEITYNNNQKETLNLPNEKVEISGYDEKIAGEQTAQIIFTYAGVEMLTKGTLTVNIIPRVEYTIEIIRTNDPIYQDTFIDTSDWEYRIVYNNGEISDNLVFSNSMVVWEDGEPILSYAEPGEYVWRIRRSAEVEIYYDIQVLPLTVDSIDFVNQLADPVDSVNVFLGDEIDTSDIYMKVTYSNGQLREPSSGLPGIPLQKENVSFDNLSEGLKVANVHYEDDYIPSFDTTLNVNVIRRVLNVEVSNYPEVNYILREIFNPEGLELIVNYEYLGSSTTLKYEDQDFALKGWSFECEWFDENNRFTKTDGEIVAGSPINIVVYLKNPGLATSFPLDVTVTNDFVDFSPNPFYKKIVDGGIEYFQPVENLGSVLPGKEIDYGTYYIEVLYESETAFKEIKKEMVSDPDINNTILPTRTVTVYYPMVPPIGEEDTIPSRTTTVEVLEVSIIGIEIVSLPTKTDYYMVPGGSIPLDPSGILLHILYDNDTRKTINTEQAIEDDKLLFAGFNSGDVGLQEITVTYFDEYATRWETTFDVTVSAAALTSIVWEGNESDVKWYEYGGKKVPSTTKREGEDIQPLTLNTSALTEGEIEYYSRDFSSLLVVRTFSDGTSDTITYEELVMDLDVDDYNKDSSITQYSRLNYRYSSSQEIYLSFVVFMLKSVLTEIYITEDSPELVAVQGADIDLKGVKLGLRFQTGEQIEADPKFIPMIQSLIQISAENPNGYDKTNRTVGERTVTIRYTFDGVTRTTDVQVNITEKKLIRIELSEIPKQFYIEGEDFDNQTGSITAFYNNGETELRDFSEAVVDSEGLFKISTENFDNREFTGYDKVQRILVYYASDIQYDDLQSLGFNIVMRDRKEVEARFSTQNIYTFTYGTANAPLVELWGFDTYSSPVRDRKYLNSDFRVEYIEENIWLSQAMSPLIDYTDLPTRAGTYYIVVTFDGGAENDFNGDAIHNKYQNTDKRLVINKKSLYFSFYPGQKKIYGTENPPILLVMKGLKSDVILDNPLTLFAYQDYFSHENFNPSSEVYPSICYLSDKYGNQFIDPGTGEPIELNMFDFRISRAGGETLSEGSSAGTYSISFTANKIISNNYNIIFEDSVFNVEKRKVVVSPLSVSYIYGDPMPIISFETEKVTLPEPINDSGLYGADTLTGQLNRVNPDVSDVGSYLITRGNLGLSNLNYEVIFSNTVESPDPKYVNILAKNIYVRADSIVKVYGDLFMQPTVQYFKDSLCTITNGAFALGDDPSDLGTLSFEHSVDYLSPVGKYDVMPIITPNLESSSNYNVICSNGIVVVEKRAVLVSPVNIQKIFGQSDPATLTYTASPVSGILSSGLVALRDEYGIPRVEGGVAITEHLAGSLTRDLGEDVGTYSIRIGDLMQENSNYSITYVPANLTILKKDLYVSINTSSLTKTYDGRKPSILKSDLTVLEYVSGQYSTYSNSSSVLPFVEVSCPYSLKNVGQYTVELSNSNPNYSISLNNTYVFTVLPKTVRIQYNDLPANQQYKATPYIISASINLEDLQLQYNEDGTVKTDHNNQPIYDNVSVYLTLSSALNAGTYSTKVDSISDPLNYYLPVENNPTVQFSILPRTISVSINVNSPDGLTFQKEYDGISAGFQPTDYYLGNLIPGYEDPLPMFEMGAQVTQGDQPSDVRFDSNGNVISYNVSILENSDDSNFIYQLSKPYMYRITPKAARISIIENYLTKSYDGNLPTITSGMYSFVESENIDKDDIIFTFSRITGNDGRTNVDAGEYGIAVSSLDRNYTVSLAQNYFYTINKKNVNIIISASARERQYNGEQAAFLKSSISVSVGTASIPKVRNYLNDGSYNDFVSELEEISSSANDLRIAIDKIIIDADSVPFTRTNIVSAQTSYLAASNMLSLYGSILEAESLSVISAAYIGINDKLNATLVALNSGNLDLAQGNLDLTKGYMQMAYTKITYENTYLAFEFGTVGVTDTSNAGVYPYIFTSKDYNVEFILAYAPENRIITINPKILLVSINDIHVRYGNAKLETEYQTYIDYSYYMSNGGYSLRDPQTNELVTLGSIVGFPRPIEDLEKTSEVGRYQLYIEHPTTLEKYISESTGNYTLVTSSQSYFYIDKALLTLRLSNHGYEVPIPYGTSLEMFAVQGYEYLDFDSSTFLEDESLWEEAGVTGLDDPDIVQKLKDTYGGIVSPHEFATQIIDSSVVYNCYLNPLNPGLGEIFNRVVNVNTYSLNATGFATTSNSYEIRVLPGNVKISRKALQPKYLQGGSYLTRTYGNAYVDLAFDGILDQDIMGFSNLPVYTIGPEGNLTGIPYSAGSPEFSSILLNGDDTTYTENSDALDPTKSVNSTDLYVYFDNQVYNQPGYEYVLGNYSFSFSSSYELRINKRDASLRVESGAGSAVINTVYGSGANPSLIDYRIYYSNLAPHESAEGLGIEKGGAIEPVIDFIQNAGQVTLDGSNVSFPYEVLNGALVNYNFTVLESTLNVAKKPLSVYVRSPYLDGDKRVPILYERFLDINGGTPAFNYDYIMGRLGLITSSVLTQILPGITTRGYQFSTYIAKTDGSTNHSIVYGQYGADDFFFIDPADLANKYTTSNRFSGFVYSDSMSNVFNLGYSITASDNGYAYFSLESMSLVSHVIEMETPDYNSRVGSYRLNNLSFVGGVENYALTYEPMEYKIITQVGRMRAAKNQVILNSNKPNISDLIKVDAYRIDIMVGSVSVTPETIVFGQSDYLEKTLTSPDESTFVSNNQNYYLELEYLQTYPLYKALSSYEFTAPGQPSITLVEGRGTGQIGNPTVLEVTNMDVETRVPVRIYDESNLAGEAEFNGSSGVLPYLFHEFTPGTYLSGPYGAPLSNYEYDRIETSFRLPVIDKSLDYKASFLINGSLTSGPYITLEFLKGAPGKAYISRYDGTLPDPIESLVLDLRNAKPFDGFTHDLRIILDKRLGSVIVSFDYSTSQMVYLEDIGVTLAGTGAHVLAEQSQLGFRTENTNAYLRYFSWARQGYIDNYATKIQRININDQGLFGNGDHDLHIVLNNNKVLSATIDVRNVFSPYMPAIEGQRFEYYVNGILQQSIEYEDDIELYSDLTLYPGLNNVEVYVYYNDGVSPEIMVCREIADVLVDNEPFRYSLTKSSESTPVSLDGGAMRFYIPNSGYTEPEYVLDAASSPEMSRFILSHYSTAGTEAPNSPLIRSAEFSMSFAEAKKQTGTSTEEYYLGESKYSFNLFMDGATYATDDGSGTLRGISLILNKNRTSQATYSYSGKLVVANRLATSKHTPKQITVPFNELSTFDFDDGAIYTFGFYLDRDDINNYESLGYDRRVGDGGLYIRILRNGVKVFDQYVDTEYVIDNASTTVTLSDPNYDILSPIWLTQATGQSNGISIGASKVFRNTLYDVSINKNSSSNVDYLVDGSYQQKDVRQGNSLNALGDEISVMLSDGYENQLISRFENTAISYTSNSLGTTPGWVWHIVGNTPIGVGYDNKYNKGMKLVYDDVAGELNFVFYYEGMDYLEQPLSVPLAGLLDSSVKHNIRVEFDRLRYSTDSSTSYNVMAGSLALTDSNSSGLPIHYGKALVFIDNMPAQEVFFPYYESGEAWYRTNNDITYGTTYQGAGTESAYADYSQFFNCYNLGELVFIDSDITLHDYSSHFGTTNSEYLDVVDNGIPAI